ncbi:MAG: hypothetical protein M1493_00005, partial [Firmicutes bacterium]|nr:hypothetical protein [Bacillota bacterium]
MAGTTKRRGHHLVDSTKLMDCGKHHDLTAKLCTMTVTGRMDKYAIRGTCSRIPDSDPSRHKFSQFSK